MGLGDDGHDRTRGGEEKEKCRGGAVRSLVLLLEGVWFIHKRA